MAAIREFIQAIDQLYAQSEDEAWEWLRYVVDRGYEPAMQSGAVLFIKAGNGVAIAAALRKGQLVWTSSVSPTIGHPTPVSAVIFTETELSNRPAVAQGWDGGVAPADQAQLQQPNVAGVMPWGDIQPMAPTAPPSKAKRALAKAQAGDWGYVDPDYCS